LDKDFHKLLSSVTDYRAGVDPTISATILVLAQPDTQKHTHRPRHERLCRPRHVPDLVYSIL